MPQPTCNPSTPCSCCVAASEAEQWPGLYVDEAGLTPFEFLQLTAQSSQSALPGCGQRDIPVVDVLRVLQVAALMFGFAGANLEAAAAKIAARLAR